MSQNISIQLSPSTIQLLPGENTDVSITVTNNSGHLTRFLLALPDLESDWYNFSKSDFLLYPEEPGNSDTITLRLTIPAHATPGSYNPIINVIDADTQQISATFPFILVVNTKLRVPPELTITPDNQTSRQKIVHYQVKVRQVSDMTTDNLVLFATPLITVRPRKGTPRSGISLAIRPRTITLHPYEEVLCSLEVRALRRNWFGVDRRHEFNVGIQGTSIEKTGNFIQTCRFPWIRKIAATPLYLAGVLLLPIILAVALIFLLIPRPQTSNAANLDNTVLSSTCFTPPSYSQSSYIQMQGSSSYIILTTPNGEPQTVAYRTDSSQLPGLFSSLTSVSPNETTVAYVSAANESLDNASIYVVDVRQHQSRLIATLDPGTSLWPVRPIWSKDSDALAYVVLNKGKLQLMEVSLSSTTLTGSVLADSGTVTSLTPSLFYTSNPNARPMCWADDSKSILVNGASNSGGTQVPIDVRIRPKAFAANVASAADLNNGILQPAPIDTTSACYLKPLSQLDPQWRDNSVGSNNVRLASNGCPVTTLAMVLNYFNSTNPNTPAQISTCVGDNANSINWAQVGTLSCGTGLQGGTVSSFNWDNLNNSLLRGLPVIVGMSGGQNAMRYVVVVSGANSVASTYRVNDPWDGTSYKTLSDFIAEGYLLRTMITYSSATLPACNNRAVIPGQPATQLLVQSFYDGELLNQPGFRVSFADNRPVTATLYSLSGSISSTINSGNTATSTSSATAQTVFTSNANTSQVQLTSQTIQSGNAVNSEGLYTLVLETSSDSGQPLREIWHFLLDTTPPNVNTQFTPALSKLNNDLVSNGPTSILFSAGDNLSGVSEVRYSLDGAPEQAYPLDGSASPISVTTYAKHSLVYYAKDLAGNTSGSQTVGFNIETQQQISSNVTNTTVATIITNKTPPPSNNGSGNGANGSGNGANGGGANGGGAATTTTTKAIVPTTPPTTAPTVAAGQLTVPSPLLNYDANTATSTFTIINTGASPALWTIQPAAAPLATLLGFPQTSGTVPANGTVNVPVNLIAYNTTAAPLSGVFQLVYANGVGRIPINVTVANQPAPTITWVSPAASAVISTGVNVQLKVTPTGAAKPDHISLSAKYIAAAGGQAASVPLTATATLANNWTVYWPTPASLPPQTGMEIDGTVCWTADQSNCAIFPSLSGLSIPQPKATFSLSQQPTLSSNVTITAQVTGFVNHITYSYSYNLNGSVTTTALSAKGMGNSSAVGWSTTAIPPQNGTISLNALVCWSTDDSACGPQTVATGLTTTAPSITGNALGSASNLPLTVGLSGNVSNLTSSSPAVFITYTYTLNGSATITAVQGTLNTSSGTWTANVDTSKFTPQTLSFWPEVCWDGKFGGSYCYSVTAPIVGTIPDFSVNLKTTSSNLDAPVNIIAATAPIGRASQAVLFANFNDLAGISHTVSIMTTTVGASDGNANFNNIDSVALGIPPGVGVTFYTQICGSTTPAYCATPNTTLTNLKADDTAIIANPAPSSLPPTFNVNAIDNVRGASKLSFTAGYLTNPGVASSFITTTIYSTTSALAVGQSVSFAWNTSAIPPQSGITTNYIACWGTFTGNCKTYNLYQNQLSIAAPQVTKFYLNGSSNSYDTSTVLPIPIDTSNLAIIQLPIATTVTTGTTGVQWTLQITDGNLNPLLQQPLALVTTTIPSQAGQFNTTVPINLATLQATGIQLANMHVQLIASPIWNTSTGSLVYVGTGSSLKLNTELVTVAASMVTANSNGVGYQGLSFSSNNSYSPVMITNTTYFSFTFSDNSVVKNMLFQVTTPSVVTTTLNANAVPVGSYWQATWDHVNDSPQILPQSNINLIWTVCSTNTQTNTGDLSTCLPFNTPGAVSVVPNLTLESIQLTQYASSSTGITFNSAFTVTVRSSIPITNSNTGQVRFFAYSPVSFNRVQLGSYFVGFAPSGSAIYQLYWPSGSVTPTAGTVTSASLAQLLPYNSSGNNIAISVQYCNGIVPDQTTSPDSGYCTDWKGQDAYAMTQYIKNNSTTSNQWVASVVGKQPIITIWHPFSTGTSSNPFTLPFSSTITITLDVISVQSSTTVTPSLLYSDQTGSNYVPISSALNGSVLGSTKTFTTTWVAPSPFMTGTTILLKSSDNTDASILVGAIGNSTGRYVSAAPTLATLPPFVPPTPTPVPTTVVAADPASDPTASNSTTVAPPGANPVTTSPPVPTATPLPRPMPINH